MAIDVAEATVKGNDGLTENSVPDTAVAMAMVAVFAVV